MKYFLLYIGIFCFFPMGAQTLKAKLEAAIKQLEKDSSLKHAAIGLSVADCRTGVTVFEHQSQLGLAAASTQKLLTSGAALELLGKDFRYKTTIGYQGRLLKDSLDGYLYISEAGDPSFGSDRYSGSRPGKILEGILKALRENGIRKLPDSFMLDKVNYSSEPIPDGWIWQDIGNYYGAGVWAINWKENQYDLVLKSSSIIGSPVEILPVKTNAIENVAYQNLATAATAGSGDNAYLYLPIGSKRSVLSGTIPINEQQFTISGSSANGQDYFINDLREKLQEENILRPVKKYYQLEARAQNSGKTIFTYESPALDSIIYWFLKKSINLYGEALVKTLAFEKEGVGSTTKGVELIRNFWSQRGIEKSAINILDGSGLSPQNRVSAAALVKVLQYARTRPWFNAFYDALPLHNGMKMKSGSINGARSYAGYQTAKDGNTYCFAIIINNFDGDPAAVIRKMFTVLNILK